MAPRVRDEWIQCSSRRLPAAFSRVMLNGSCSSISVRYGPFSEVKFLWRYFQQLRHIYPFNGRLWWRRVGVTLHWSNLKKAIRSGSLADACSWVAKEAKKKEGQRLRKSWGGTSQMVAPMDMASLILRHTQIVGIILCWFVGDRFSSLVQWRNKE
jgi:hypothetical protein